LREEFGDGKLSVKTGWHISIDFTKSIINHKNKSYTVSPVGTAAQELILTQGLENWVKKKIK
jgi:hypothetical protein